MEKLNSFTKTAARIIEIIFWICAGLLLIIFITTLFVPAKLIEPYLIATELPSMIMIKFVSLIAIIPIVLMALIARNINLIFKKMYSNIQVSKKIGPFQDDTARLVREIGIFIIAIPITNLILSSISLVFFKSIAFDTGVGIGGIAAGIIVLCLSQIFAYGSELEKDIDGLV